MSSRSISSLSGVSPSTSCSPRSIVAMNESTIPTTPTSTVMIAPTPSSVSRARRGARIRFRNGIRMMLLPGIGRRFSSGASPPPLAARCPVRIASTGATRTALHTGYDTAAKGSRKPAAATPANSPTWNGVFHMGSGSSELSTPFISSPITSPTPIPNRTPRSAICAPTSSGRSATLYAGVPSAIATPISRRCDSTIRLVRLNAANAAPRKRAVPKMFQNCRSPSGSSVTARYDRSCSGSMTVAPRSSNSSRSSSTTTAVSAESTSVSTRSLTTSSRPPSRCAVSMVVKMTPKLACARKSPSSVTTMKYSGARPWPT